MLHINFRDSEMSRSSRGRFTTNKAKKYWKFLMTYETTAHSVKDEDKLEQTLLGVKFHWWNDMKAHNSIKIPVTNIVPAQIIMLSQ